MSFINSTIVCKYTVYKLDNTIRLDKILLCDVNPSILFLCLGHLTPGTCAVWSIVEYCGLDNIEDLPSDWSTLIT